MKVSWKGALSAIGISVLWGGNIIAIKVALQGIPPMMMAGLTFLLGTLSLLLWTRLNRIPIRASWQETIDHLINGLLFTVQIALFYFGAHLTSASHAVILTNTNIFFVALLAHFFILEDRLTLLKMLGLVLAFIGVVYLFLDRPSLSSPTSLSGNLIVLLSAFLLGVRIIYIKHLIEGIEPSKVVLWQMLIGVPLFFSLSFFFEGMNIQTPSLRIMTALLYQGFVIAGFTFVASTLLLKHYSPTSISSFFFAVPIAGVVLSHWILAEAFTRHILVSAILVALGIWLVNVKERLVVD